MAEAARPAANRPRAREAALPAERRFSLDDAREARAAQDDRTVRRDAGGVEERRTDTAAAERDRRAETRSGPRATPAAQARSAARARPAADDRPPAPEQADETSKETDAPTEAASAGSGTRADGATTATTDEEAVEDSAEAATAATTPVPPPGSVPGTPAPVPQTPAQAAPGDAGAPSPATGRVAAATAGAPEATAAGAEVGPGGAPVAPGFALPPGTPNPSTLAAAAGGTTPGTGTIAPAPAAAPPSGTPVPTPPTPLSAVPMTIGLRALADSNRFEIRLDPAHLGRVAVSLDIDRERGAVKAHLVVERPETLALLQRDARSLEQALSQAGLSAGEAALSFSLGDGSAGSRGGTGRDDDGSRAGARPALPEAEPLPAAAVARLGRRTGLDLVI
jgi:flagellar hook-length control protein FliK